MAQSKYYNTGGGTLYFTPIVDGVLGTEVDFGGTENVSFSSELEKLEHDNTEGSVVVVDKTLLKKITGTINIETIEASPVMLERAFLGDTSSSVVAANIIGTTPSLGYVTVTALGVAYPISAKHIDISTVVVQDDSDTTTYDINVDYTLSVIGDTTYVTALTTGSILAGDVLHVDADNASYNDVKLEAFMQSQLEGQLRFVSKPANGLAYEYLFHRVSLTASGDYSLKSADEFSKLSFEGDMLASELITASDESKLFVVSYTEAV